MSEEREAKSEDEAPVESGGAAPEAGEAAETSDAAADQAQESAPERVDEDGLPLDRDATIDDVRSKEARHSRIALGCTLVILLLIAAFFVVRAGVLG